MVEFGDLITKEKIEEDDDFQAFINPMSKAEVCLAPEHGYLARLMYATLTCILVDSQTPMYGEPALRNVKQDQRVQLQRRGFFRCDKYGTDAKEPMVTTAVTHHDCVLLLYMAAHPALFSYLRDITNVLHT